jgi:hypothetical protein
VVEALISNKKAFSKDCSHNCQISRQQLLYILEELLKCSQISTKLFSNPILRDSPKFKGSAYANGDAHNASTTMEKTPKCYANDQSTI